MKIKKQKFLTALVSVLLIPMAFIFTGCFGDDTTDSSMKLPTNAYEKVQFAFNGVQSSFQSELASKASAYSEENVAQENVAELLTSITSDQNVLNTINSVYTSGDSEGDVIDDLEYNQPPMIQFQCLKAVIEEIGSSYSFGTKYYNNITGTMYMNMATGYAVTDESEKTQANKYDYTFVFAIQIDIDSTDFITANVSFDITLTQGTQMYTTHWYVEMKLDYDMTNTTPNYELLMLTANDEAQLPFYSDLGHVYEYDYVKVNNNKINEWRKFVLETEQSIITDATHNSFDNYINENVAYTADTVKWYKNNNLRKVTQMTQEKERVVANAFFDLGLNSTAIDAGPFTNKAGVQVEDIKTLYGTISEKFRQDVIYQLACKKEYHNNNNGENNGNGDQGNNNNGENNGNQGEGNGEDNQLGGELRFFVAGQDQLGFENMNVKQNSETTIEDLFNPASNVWTGAEVPEIWASSPKWVKITDFSMLYIYITPKNQAPIMVDLTTKLESVLNVDELKDPGKYQIEFTIEVALNTNSQVCGQSKNYYNYEIQYSGPVGVVRTSANVITIWDNITIPSLAGDHNELRGDEITNVEGLDIYYVNSNGEQTGKVPNDKLVFEIRDSFYSTESEDRYYYITTTMLEDYDVARLFHMYQRDMDDLSLKIRVTVQDFSESPFVFDIYIPICLEQSVSPVYRAIHGVWPVDAIENAMLYHDLFPEPSESYSGREDYIGIEIFAYKYEYDIDYENQIISITLRFSGDGLERYILKELIQRLEYCDMGDGTYVRGEYVIEVTNQAVGVYNGTTTLTYYRNVIK